MSRFKPFLLILFLFIPFSIFSQQTKNYFQLKDIRKIVTLSEPRLSPDGSQIAYIVTKSEWAHDSTLQEIDLVNVSTGKIRCLTFNRSGISNPSWSPDGSKLGFIANDAETNQPQIFIMPMNGGDPIRITESKTGVDEFSWSPNGNEIAFVAQDTVPNPKQIKHHEDAFQVTQNNYTVRAALQPWHIWIVSADGGKAKRITEGSWSLKTDQETMSPLVWSPDGKSIIFQRFISVWEADVWHSTIAEVDTSGGEVRTIVKEEASDQPRFSPNGKILAFMRPRNGDLNNGYAVYTDIDGKITDITRKLARNIDYSAWLPNSKEMILTGFKGTRTAMWRQPITGDAVQLNLGDIGEIEGRTTISNNGEIAFVASTATHPLELYFMKSVSASPKAMTNYNAFADSLTLGIAKNIDWKGPDNFDEDGVLNYPANFEQGHKYPLVLYIHGGPEYASTVGFSMLPELLSAQGYFVFQPNYRGSTNLGDAYQHAIFRNTGEGPGKDVMAGLAKIEQLNLIDTSKIGVSGWSYGGYMTSWLTGYYPNKWKAAIEGAALNDWVMDYTIAYYQNGDNYFFGGSPWTKKYWKIWREQSPIIFATKVKAPTLILGDVGDGNVPIVNSYEMYHALKDNGVYTEFYAYPADTHFPGSIVRRTDVYKRWLDWMNKYLK